MPKNFEIRKRIATAGLKHWQVADAIGISECTLCVWLRKELDGERLRRVQAAINALIGEVANG